MAQGVVSHWSEGLLGDGVQGRAGVGKEQDTLCYKKIMKM